MSKRNHKRADLEAQSERVTRIAQYAVAVDDGTGWTVILEDAPTAERAARQALAEWAWPVMRVNVKRAVNVDATEDGCPIRGHPVHGAAHFPS